MPRGRPFGAVDRKPRKPRVCKASAKAKAEAEPVCEEAGGDDPSGWDYLLRLMNDTAASTERRDRAASLLATLEVRRQEKLGKKAQAEQDALTSENGTAWERLLNRDNYQPQQLKPRQQSDWDSILGLPPERGQH